MFLHFFTYIEISFQEPSITYKSLIKIKDPKFAQHFISSFHFISFHHSQPAGRGSTSMGAVTARALRLPPHGFPTRGGLARFARELVPNGVASGFPNLGSRALFLLKKSPEPCKNWSFAWKIENRPTFGDFEKKNLDPQLHQIFKPIRKFFCTFLPK